jgi:hypothetical protein
MVHAFRTALHRRHDYKMNALNYNVFCIRTSGDGTNHCDIAFVNNHVL